MDMMNQAALGISLAACAGLRAWLPLFVLGLLSKFGGFSIHPQLQWLASDTALAAFGIATAVELLGDKVPAVDHLLDTIGSVLRPGAGALIVTAIAHDMDFGAAVTAGLLVGVPTSLGIHLGKAGVRLGSSAISMGTGNFVLSLVEDIVCGAFVVLAILIPVLAATLALLMLGGSIYLITRMIRARRRRNQGLEVT